jgi:hypothetical protein
VDLSTWKTFEVRMGKTGEDNGKTLVVFNTADDIILTKTQSGRQFGPFVLAPFSKVTILGDAGFVDGWIVAKTLTVKEGGDTVATSLQLHGDFYNGGFTCHDPALLSYAPPGPSITYAPPGPSITYVHRGVSVSR